MHTEEQVRVCYSSVLPPDPAPQILTRSCRLRCVTSTVKPTNTYDLANFQFVVLLVLSHSTPKDQRPHVQSDINTLESADPGTIAWSADHRLEGALYNEVMNPVGTAKGPRHKTVAHSGSPQKLTPPYIAPCHEYEQKSRREVTKSEEQDAATGSQKLTLKSPVIMPDWCAVMQGTKQLRSGYISVMTFPQTEITTRLSNAFTGYLRMISRASLPYRQPFAICPFRTSTEA